MLYYNDYTDIVVPVGVILPFATENIPSTFMECAGFELDRNEYEELFNRIGYMYGGTDPMFKLPDYQDYFIRGFDPDGVADPNNTSRLRDDGTSGAIIGSKQDDDFESHTHGYYYIFATADYSIITESKLVRYKISGTSYISRTLENQDDGISETRPENVRVIYAIRVI